MEHLLTNADFEGTGWSGGSYNTTFYRTGTRSYALTGGTGNAEVLANHSGNINITNTHIYYVRWYVYHEGAPGTTGCYFGIAEPSFREGISLGPANQWNLISARNNRASFASGAQGFRFDYNNGNQNGTIYIDSAMVLDLTDIFGEGNEPSQLWCDTHIPFFTGTSSVTIETGVFKVNVNGEWKEADSAYVNVNGEWKLVEDVYVNVNGTWKVSV